MFFTVWVIFHVIVCLGLILVVLMQSAKGEGLAGSAFGGGGGGLGGAVFGGRGAATFLSNATTVLAIVFMVNCGVLAFMSASPKQVITDASGVTDSPITRQAQQEYEQQMATQQQQQQVVADTGDISLEALTKPPAEDTSGN